LDTNVWIDWLIFDNPSVEPLKAAHRAGRVTIAVNEACLEELKLVLGYPEFNLIEAREKHCLAEARRCSSHTAQQQESAAALPRCSDPDDQKFLMLAYQAAAQWLLTRDKALLRMKPRLKATGIRVGSPEDWSTAYVRSA
jgi:putative PIN family toxin of toxin-antitoxin system